MFEKTLEKSKTTEILTTPPRENDTVKKKRIKKM